MRIATALIGLAAFAAVMWFAFLGWDQEYSVVNGAVQGPYRPWQVVGCGAAITAAATAALLYLRRAWTLAVIPAVAVAGFAVPWAAWASADDSGLWVVGLVLLLGGGIAGLTLWLGLVFAAAETARNRRARRAG
ncbi:hypothetical protein [Tsukamurella sp. 1534]|uniref:hypothetical protein n=1 Tax=Tsukamurella sp. 1534 TaxID=1151061 RepID=UPI0003118F4C|nr:hypothetical protein [Tsukamurella sp. 1534]